MNWYHREPTLDEILSDSIVRAVMEADACDNLPESGLANQSGADSIDRIYPRGAPSRPLLTELSTSISGFSFPPRFKTSGWLPISVDCL